MEKEWDVMLKRSSALAALALTFILSACSSIGATNDLSPAEQSALLADFNVDPEDRAIDRFCIRPDWPVVHGSTFTEKAYDARFSFVKRIGRHNAYLIEYTDSCTRLTRSGLVGVAIPVDCRGDIIRVRSIPCRVERIYRVESESDARRLALVIQRDRELKSTPSPVQEIAGFGQPDAQTLP